MTDPHHHNPGILARIALFLLGADPRRAAWAGRDDQAHIRLLALSLTLLFVWVAFNSAHALSIATGAPYLSAEVMIWSPLLAGLYVVVDRALIRGRFWAQGVALARARGFDAAPRNGWQAFGAAVGALPFTLMRLSLALAVAAFCAFSFGLWFWERDITARMQADHSAVNAALRSRIEGEVAQEIALTDRQIAAIAERIEARAVLAQRVQQQAQETQTTLRARALGDLAAVDARLAELEARIDCAQQDVDAERDGGIDCRGIQRAAGRLARFDAAVADLDRLLVQRAALLAERAAAQEAVAAIPAPPAVAPDPEDAQLEALRAQRAEMMAARGATVETRLRADPAWVPPPDGPILRQRTLLALAMDEPVLLGLMIVIYTMFLLLDLAVVAIAFGHGPASIYALRQVTEFEERAADQIARSRLAMAQSLQRVAEAEAARLEAELKVLRADADFKAEVRRLAMIDTLLERRAGAGGDDTVEGPTHPRFDA